MNIKEKMPYLLVQLVCAGINVPYVVGNPENYINWLAIGMATFFFFRILFDK